MYLSHRVISKC